jgi:fatty-acyl-CoA synthase
MGHGTEPDRRHGSQIMTAAKLLWPVCDGPEDLARIEEVSLQERGLPASTYDVLARAASLWPERPAVSFFPSAERWREISTRTFAELVADVHRLAHVLATLGVGRSDAVALVSPNCEQLLTALLAAEAVGIAAPINPGLISEHARRLVELAGARVIVAAGPELDATSWDLARQLTQRTGVGALLALRPVLPTQERPALQQLGGAVVAYVEDLTNDAASDSLPASGPTATDLASYLHTGGTTGTPKLAARTHGNEVSNAWMVASSSTVAGEGAVFAALPLFHTNALIVTLLAPLLRGQHVVWAGPLGYRDLALYGRFWQLVEGYRIAAMSGVPTVYAALAQVPLDADISSLKYPVVGAAPLPLALVDAFKTRTGLDLCEGYGLTEGTCASTRNYPAAIRSGSVGQRLPYQGIRAVRIDEQTDEWETLSPGEVGTIVIAGPNVFAGYLTPGPEGPTPERGAEVREGWLNTGDLGSVDAEGYLRLVGRAKDLIIRGGHNIDPTVIEDALLRHPEVTAAAAVGRPDAYAGEVPVAYVTLAPGSTTSPEALLQWVAEQVPERAAAPKLIEVIDAIPLTLVGKPYKLELRRRATEQAARDVLPTGAAVTAELNEGAVSVTIAGVADDVAQRALAPFAFAWKVS